MAERVVMVVNPAAGGGRCGRAWPTWARRLGAAGILFTAVYTTRPGDATRLAQAALRGGARTVVAVGGDGTANEVVNGFFEGGRPVNPEARFGLLPLGTGADLARSLGVRGQSAIAALGPSGRTGRIDVGRVQFVAFGGHAEERLFVNGSDLGLGGETAALAQKGPKALPGPISYLIAAVRAILAHHSYNVQFSLDGGPPVATAIEILFVVNGRYVAGGMPVAPMALLDDGEMDVLMLRAVGKLALLRLLVALNRGTHLLHPDVQHVRARRVGVETSARIPLESDGEPIGMAPATFEILPGALPIALPPPPASSTC